MKYLLDEQNSPVGFSIQYPGNASNYWQSYYLGKNLQGDVVNLYRSDPKGNSDVATLVATYRYDPWGKVQGIFKPNGEKIPETAVHVAAYNPFRYRGYRYDGDTGFYYLQSRYYDPAICRFISADAFASTGQGFLGYNMFAYCNNNPVVGYDPTGEFALGAYLLKAAVGAVVNTVTSYIGAKVTGQDFGWGDAAKAAAYGAFGSINKPFAIGVACLSGFSTACSAYKNGASIGESLIRGTANTFGTICSVSNLAGWSGIELDTASAAFVDLVFGTASTTLSSAISKSCDDRHSASRKNTNNKKRQTSSKNVATSSRNTPKSKN